MPPHAKPDLTGIASLPGGTLLTHQAEALTLEDLKIDISGTVSRRCDGDTRSSHEPPTLAADLKSADVSSSS